LTTEALIHITNHNEAWDEIAKKYYGSEHYMHLLLEANPELAKYELLPANIKVIVPEKPEEVKTENLPIWKR